MSVYVAATRQNDGKTVGSLGLINALAKRAKNIGYMKPVGQQYHLIDGEKIDKDVVLMQKIFGYTTPLPFMSPIAIPAGFTEQYIMNGDHSALVDKVKNSYDKLRESYDYILVEGTGHAGVGSVFDMSNSQVASILGLKVIIVTCGGIGRPIDEILLNYATFSNRGVQVLGVIVNKVLKKKYEKVNDLVRRGFSQKGIDVLGVVPFERILSNPLVSELLAQLEGELLCGEKGLTNSIERFVIGDMVAHEAFAYLKGSTILITSGYREAFIFAALGGAMFGATGQYNIAGIIITYGRKPPQKVIDVIARLDIPLVVVEEDSFTIAHAIANMIFKLRAEDKTKIKKTELLIEKYVDVDKIYEMTK
jgi:dethiobiotin synthase